jgi:hypothetical protein
MAEEEDKRGREEDEAGTDTTGEAKGFIFAYLYTEILQQSKRDFLQGSAK